MMHSDNWWMTMQSHNLAPNNIQKQYNFEGIQIVVL